MAVVDGIIRAEDDGSVSFGDYLSEEEQTVRDFKIGGASYNAAASREGTKLEKDGALLFETAPGAAAHNMLIKPDAAAFELEGFEDTRVTLALAPEKIYRVVIEGNNIGNIRSNTEGRLVFSLELDISPKAISVTAS